MSESDNKKQQYQEILNKINSELQTIPEKWHEPASDELKQFKKSAFYHNWYGRFHSLGLYGVLAIPNTTFEEWLWWFHEWAEAFLDDYNQFKRDVYNALKLLQDYLDALKKDVDNVKDRMTELERQMQEVKQQIERLGDEINNLKNEVSNLKNEINNLKNENQDLKNRVGQLENGLGKILQHLQDQGAWHGGDTIYNGDFNNGQSVASGTINVYGISAGGNYYIKTHTGGDRDGDIVQGLN